MASGDFDWELQGTLFRTFKNDATIQGVGNAANPGVNGGAPLGTVVCDFVPPGVTFPFIKIGDMDDTDLGDKSEPGSAVMATVMVFSRAKDNDELNQICKAIRVLLHEKPVRIANGLMVLCRFHSSVNRLLSDAITRQRVLHYFFFLSENLPSTSPT